MKKKILVLIFIFLVFICFIFQCTIFKRLNFGGISPNLLMITTTSIGLMKGEKPGIYAGFLSGLFIDIFFGNVLGLYAFMYMLIGYIVGKFSRIFYPEDLKLPLVLIALSDLSYGMICYVFLFMLRGRFHFSYYFLHIIVPEMIYTILISIVFYPFILFVYKRLNVDDSRSEIDFV